MKNFDLKIVTQLLATLAFVTISSSAFALTTWNLNGSCLPENGSVPNALHNCGSDVTVTGFSTGTGTIAAPTAGLNFAAAAVYNWGSGLGVVATNESSSSTGPHATDNAFGTDAMLIKFDAATSLSQVTIGWNGGTSSALTPYVDSDISVLAWTGSGAPPAGVITGKTAAELTAVGAGWTLVGEYSDVGGLANTTALVSTSITSSYWLVSAYDTNFGGGKGWSMGNDAFKLVSVAGTQTYKTPEPGSLALLGLGLIGVAAARRRSLAAAV